MATDIEIDEHQRILAEIRKSNEDTGKLIEEAKKLRSEDIKLRVEADKLRSEGMKFRSEAEKLRVGTGKMARESTWYPAIFIATAVGAGAAFAKLFL